MLNITVVPLHLTDSHAAHHTINSRAGAADLLSSKKMYFLSYYAKTTRISLSLLGCGITVSVINQKREVEKLLWQWEWVYLRAASGPVTTLAGLWDNRWKCLGGGRNRGAAEREWAALQTILWKFHVLSLLISHYTVIKSLARRLCQFLGRW